jgi:hypothetical protein
MNKSFQNRVMRASKLFVAATFVWSATCSVFAADQQESGTSITPYEAVYSAFKWGSEVGEARIKLEEISDNQYSLTYGSKVSKFFLSDKRHEHSIFKVTDGQLIPQEYHYSRTGTGPDKQLDVVFSEENGKIMVAQGETFDFTGQYDNQIYRIDLAKRLADGETHIDYQFINYRGELREYGVEVLAREALTLPFGQLNTIKVKLIRDSKTRETYAWFAPNLDYALVRLQQFKDGDEQGDIKLKSFQLL